MRSLDLTVREYEPPSLCHTGLEPLFAIGAAEAATAGTAAAGLTAAELGAGAAAGFAGGVGSGVAAAVPAAAGLSSAAGFALPSLSTLGTVATIAGTGLQAKAQMDQAAYEQAVAKNQAEALRIRAGEETAAAQRQQIAQERKAGLVTSRARALGAASGTDATSPTQIDIEGDIAATGRYNALSSLYEGLSAARADNYQADINLFKGKRIGAAVPLAVGGTLLSGLGSFVDRRSYRRSGGGFFGLSDA